MNWLRKMYEWTLRFADKKYNVLALSFISFIEASFFLIPPEVLFLPMATSKPKKAFYFAGIMSLSSVAGAILGYWIGHAFWDIASPYFFEYVFKEEQYAYVTGLFQDNTFETIFVAGFTPIPFKVFTIVAGAVNAPLATFIFAALISRTLRYFIMASLFFFLGPSVKEWIDKHFEKATILLTILILALIVYIKTKH